MAYGFTRKYRRGWYRPTVARRQQTGNRYFTITFPVESIVTGTIAADQQFSNVIRTSPYYERLGTVPDATLALYSCSLMSSTAYRTYCRLYDSCKINSVGLRFSLATTVGAGGIPGLRCYTCWDRNFMIEDSGDVLTAAQLIDGPESQVVTFINNSRCKFSRYNRAMDLQERTTFHDCSIKYVENTHRTDMLWFGDSTHSGQIGYVPSLSLVLQASNTEATTRSIPIQIQASYSVTFRNPRYGLSASSLSKFGDDREEIVEEVKKMDDEKEGVEELKKKIAKLEKELDGFRETEVLKDDEENVMDEDEESQEPITQPVKSAMKKVGKKSS